MLLPFLWLMAWSAPEAPPSLASIEGLSPEAAGELILKDRDHGVIESVTRDLGLDAPGVTTLKLRERPSRISGGCVRTNWSASFGRRPGATQGSATLTNTYAVTEVSLPTLPDCSQGQFVHVNPGLAVEEAFSALKVLQDIRSGRAKVSFSCSDSTASALCETAETIRQELTRLPAWAVTRKNRETLELWLGERGQAVTALSISATAPGQVMVERRVPAPF